MKNHESNNRKALQSVAESIIAGNRIEVEEAVLSQYGGDAAEYMVAAYEAAMRRDKAALVRNVRDAELNGLGRQVELPGMGHGTLAVSVVVKDTETGEQSIMPGGQATLAQHKEDNRMTGKRVRQMMAHQEKKEQTLDKLTELGVPESATGSEIAHQFPPALEA